MVVATPSVSFIPPVPALQPECALTAASSLDMGPAPRPQMINGKPYGIPRNWSSWFGTVCACKDSAAALRAQQSGGSEELAGAPLSPWPYTCRNTYRTATDVSSAFQQSLRIPMPWRV